MSSVLKSMLAFLVVVCSKLTILLPCLTVAWVYLTTLVLEHCGIQVSAARVGSPSNSNALIVLTSASDWDGENVGCTKDGEEVSDYAAITSFFLLIDDSI